MTVTASMAATGPSVSDGSGSIEASAIPAISGGESTRLAVAEYTRFTDLIRRLGPDDFCRPTDCTGWDVRAIIVHQVGAGEGHARWPELVRTTILGMRLAKGRELVDGLNDVQLRERSDWSAERAVAALPEVQARAARGRRRLPALFRIMPVTAAGVARFSMGFLYDVVLTRDTWMHRVDISRATGRDLVLTSEHDGRVVADIVADWARQHRRPFRLRLLGAAGGRYHQGSSGEEIEMDAIEFCRTTSGRANGTGLLAQRVAW
jgi:uncharacterized protein (TIGR03083 family)